MVINIKSEMDSRVVLYPLIKALRSYGSVLVVSTNKCVARLIEDPDLNTCRDITIFVTEDGILREVYRENNLHNEDFDFVIIDNAVVDDYDVLLVPLGKLSTPNFDDEIQYMLMEEDSNKMYILQYGKSLKQGSKKKSEPKKAKTTSSEVGDDYDPAAKFRDKATEKKKNDNNKIYNCNFPTFEMLEMVEGEHKFPPVDASLCTAFYDIFKTQVGSNSNEFRKVAQKKDEYSGYIESRNSIG